jgi:lipopolysaccharide transport system ATP-binding protein
VLINFNLRKTKAVLIKGIAKQIIIKAVQVFKLPIPLCTKPGFLIIGTQKGGTTTLYHMLKQHPQVTMLEIKEVHFFDKNYFKGNDWYLKHFPRESLTKRKIAGEASPYYLFHPLVPGRVATHFPGVKLIVLLRNPIDRAYSQFRHEQKLGNEPGQSFGEAIQRELSEFEKEEKKLINGETNFSRFHSSFSYLHRGLYFQQISRWLNYFSKDQILFIKSEDFFQHPKEELKKVYRFLGINCIFPKDTSPMNVNTYPALDNDLKQKLRDFFSSDAKQLAGLIGEKFNWSST